MLNIPICRPPTCTTLWVPSGKSERSPTSSSVLPFAVLDVSPRAVGSSGAFGTVCASFGADSLSVPASSGDCVLSAIFPPFRTLLISDHLAQCLVSRVAGSRRGTPLLAQGVGSDLAAHPKNRSANLPLQVEAGSLRGR